MTTDKNKMHLSVASSTLSGIPELLDKIFQALDKQSLGRLARVSSDFHHTSIAHLWSTRTLEELLRLLPEGILDDNYRYRTRTLLLRTPQGSDWDRFHHYSVYTTSLDICTRECPLSLMTTLADRSDLFFPRLRDLVIRAPSHEYPAAECVRIARQTLRRLEVDGGHVFRGQDVSYDSDLTSSFLRQLTMQAPNLAEFKIDCFQALHLDPKIPAAIIETFCLALRSLPNLKKLDWNLGFTGSLPGPILAAIAVHPSISEMVLDKLEVWPIMGNDSRHFPSLTLAKFDCHRDGGIAFVRTISNPSILSTLDMTFYDKEDDLSLRAFQPFSRLFHLALNLTVLRLLWPVSFSWAQLEPILNCKLLIRLTISPRTPIAGFNDQALRDLASSLLSLELLRLLPARRNIPAADITLLGLLPLAQFCPRLLTLTITVTTRVHDPSMVEALRKFQPAILHPLQELSLDGSDMNVGADTLGFMGARRTAGVLTFLWPLLRSNHVWYGWGSSIEPAPKMREAWKGVHRYLEQREQDREPIPFI